MARQIAGVAVKNAANGQRAKKRAQRQRRENGPKKRPYKPDHRCSPIVASTLLIHGHYKKGQNHEGQMTPLRPLQRHILFTDVANFAMPHLPVPKSSAHRELPLPCACAICRLTAGPSHAG